MDSVTDKHFPSVKESLENRVSFKEWKCKTPEDYKKEYQVGEGTFGKVFKAIYKSGTKEEEQVALKEIMIIDNQGFPITALREILIMKNLEHKNIMKLKEVLTAAPSDKNKKRGTVYLVFPYMENDFSGLRGNIDFNISHIKCIFHQILSGINYLHKNKIIHRDIKTSNILMNSLGEIKIGDFGLARRDNKESNKQYTNKVVTLCYRAPELLLGTNEYGTEIDIWSIGCVFCELLSDRVIFKENSDPKDQLNKIFGICGTPTEEEWPGVTKLRNWKDAPKTVYANSLREFFKNNNKVDDITFNLISSLLQLNPKKRITAEKALEHEFFKKEPLMCKEEELTFFKKEFHEFKTEKDRRENRNLLVGLKDKNFDINPIKGMEIGNKEFIGKKRTENNSKEKSS